MSGDTDPAGVKGLKEKVYSKVKPVLKKHGFDKADCGSQVGIKEEDFVEETGFWVAQRKSKPTRWFVHFVEHNGKWIAKVPEVKGSDRVAYANAKGRDNVAAVSVRVTPVFKFGDKWDFYDKWEWLMVIFFPKPLQGSTSSDLVEDFAPSGTTVVFNNEEIEMLAIHIYSLCEPGLSCDLPDVELKYSDATEYLKEMFEGEKQNGGLFGDQ